MNIFIQISTNVRTGARFSENQSAPKLENRKTSKCSPRAPIPDGRIERIMQPWTSVNSIDSVNRVDSVVSGSNVNSENSVNSIYTVYLNNVNCKSSL